MTQAKFLAVLAIVAAASLPSPAEAASPPSGLSIGIERAFGFAATSMTEDSPSGEASTSGSRFSLGLNPGSLPFSASRLGVDFITRSGFSIGTGFGLLSASASTTLDGGDAGKSAQSGFLLSPRVGYVLMFTSDVGLWPRGGIAFASSGSETEDGLGAMETSTRDIVLNLEAPLLVMPGNRFGFALHPTFDVLLSRSVEVDGDEQQGDFSGNGLGLHFGVFGVL